MKIVKVRITKSKPDYWYAGLEDEVLEVYDNRRDYILKEDYDRGHRAVWGHIDKSDCELVEEKR